MATAVVDNRKALQDILNEHFEDEDELDIRNYDFDKLLEEEDSSLSNLEEFLNLKTKEDSDADMNELIHFQENRLQDISKLDPKNIHFEDDKISVQSDDVSDPPQLHNIDLSRLSSEEEVSLEALMKAIQSKSYQGKMTSIELADKRLLDISEEEETLERVQKQRTEVRQTEVVQEVKGKKSKQKRKATVVEKGVIESISVTLKDPKLRKIAGTPATFAVSRDNLVIGTNQGVALLFHQFKFNMMIGIREGVEYGAVTAIDLSKDNVLLAIAHQNGPIVLWDLHTKRPLKTILIHTTAPLHLHFLNDNQSIISSDISGNSFHTTFKPQILFGYSNSSVPLTILKKEVVKNIAVLPPCPQSDFGLDSYNLVAITVSKKVLIVSMTSGTIITDFEPLEGAKADVPLVAWRGMLDVEESSIISPDPLLAICWGNLLEIFYVSYYAGTMTFPYLFDNKPIKLKSFYGKAMQWLGTQALLFITQHNTLIAYDPKSNNTLQDINIADIKPLFHSRYRPDGDTKKENAVLYTTYQSSLRSLNGRYFVAGNDSINFVTIISWKKRLDDLVFNGLFKDAIGLAIEQYQGQLQSILQLSDFGKGVRISRLIGDHIENIIKNYVVEGLYSFQEDEGGDHPDYIAEVVIDTCVLLNRVEFALAKLFPIFLKYKHEGSFIDKLVTFVLGKRITQLPPETVDMIIQFYEQQNDQHRIEQFLIYLDMSTLDFYTVVQTCRKNLSSALFYIFIHGLDDYIWALDENIKFFMEHQITSGESTKAVKVIGYRILLYLWYCFRGESYPVPRKISIARARKLTEQVIHYLFQDKLPRQKSRFPRVTSLLKFDSKEFLDILSLTFDINAPTDREVKIVDTLTTLMIDRKLPADNCPSIDSYDWTFTVQQQGHLFLFLAKYLCLNVQIGLDDYLTERMVAYLVGSTDPLTRDQREDTLLKLIEVFSTNDNGLPITYFTRPQYILEKALVSKFHKVCEYFYKIANDYRKVIESRIEVTEYHKGLFDYITFIYKDDSPQFTEARQTVKQTVLDHYKRLLTIDKALTAELIVKCFREYQKLIFDELQASDEKLLFAYLQGLDSVIIDDEEDEKPATSHPTTSIPAIGNLTYREMSDQDFEKLSHASLDKLPDVKKDSQSEFGKEDEKKPQIEKKNKGILGKDEMHEYFRLVCKYDPKNALEFLKNEKHRDCYSKSECKEIAQNAKILDAQAYLYESEQNYRDAVDLYLKQVQLRLDEVKTEVLESINLIPFQESTFPNSPGEQNLKSIIDEAMTFLQRNKSSLNPATSQELWFRLLETVVSALNLIQPQNRTRASENIISGQSILKKNKGTKVGSKRPGIEQPVVKDNSNNNLVSYGRLQRGYTLLVKYIIQNMISEVEIKPIIDEVVNHHSREKFGDFRDIFMSLLEDNTSDRIMLTNVSKLLEVDAFNEFKRLHKMRTNPVEKQNIQIQAEQEQGAAPQAQPAPQAQQQANKEPEPLKPEAKLIKATLDNDIPQVPLIYVLSKLQDSAKAAANNEMRSAIGADLANKLIPAMQLFKPVHINKTQLFEYSPIQLQRRTKDLMAFQYAPAEGRLSPAEAAPFRPEEPFI